MKLTDEQKDEIREAIETQGGIYSEYGLQKIRKNGIEWLQGLLKSEQAWKEEAMQHYRRWQNELEISDQIVQEREELIIQLNQAVEVIKRVHKYAKENSPDSKYIEQVQVELDHFLSQEGGKP